MKSEPDQCYRILIFDSVTQLVVSNEKAMYRGKAQGAFCNVCQSGLTNSISHWSDGFVYKILWQVKRYVTADVWLFVCLSSCMKLHDVMVEQQKATGHEIIMGITKAKKTATILVILFHFSAFQDKMATSGIHSIWHVLYVSVIDTSDYTAYCKAFKVALTKLMSMRCL